MKVCHIANYMPKYHRQSVGVEAACINTSRRFFKIVILSIQF